MVNALKYFLTHKLLPSDTAHQTWEWWILDREGLHQDILQILLNDSSEFCKKFLGYAGICIRQPQRTAFDLSVKSDSGRETFIEIKTDNKWSTEQESKQTAILCERSSARAILLLLSQSAGLTRAEVAMRGKGLFTKMSYAELYAALDIVPTTSDSAELIDLATAYKCALQEQELRIRSQFSIDDPSR
jgi:hypothetical protein